MKEVEITAKVVAIVGGLIAAFKVIIEMRENRKQRVRELRWKQSNSARELLKEMFSSKFASDASTMFEWTGREFNILDEVKEPITFDDVREALRTYDTFFNDKEIYIRDCVDSFLYYIEIIEQAIKNELIQFADVKFPMDYYVKTLKKNNLIDPLNSFIEQYDYDNAKSFFKRFVSS
jgi:hypothetical protein